jgi:hypothetical protein
MLAAIVAVAGDPSEAFKLSYGFDLFLSDRESFCSCFYLCPNTEMLLRIILMTPSNHTI